MDRDYDALPIRELGIALPAGAEVARTFSEIESAIK